MRVLFLDFDGVLHPLGLQVQPGRFVNGKPVVSILKVDYFCWLNLLMELVRPHADVRFVVHSTWRESHTEEALKAYFGEHQHLVLGATDPTIDKYPSVQAWLFEHPEVQHWRVLDDAHAEFQVTPADIDMDEPAVLAPELIPCEYQTGLTDPEVQRQLVEWLAATAPR